MLAALAGCGSPRPWNVVLFTFDTTRADFLGCYGKESARTPHLDRLAATGFLFENAMASNPVTQAAHATLLTGVWPMSHGVRDNLLFRLPEERETLAEMLAARGYATGAAVGGFPLVRSFGSDQGFDFYDDELAAARLDHRGRPVPRKSHTWYDERPAGHVNDALLPWLRERFGGEQPFFAWLHYWDPHEPHIPPAPYDQLFAHDPYQGEIAYADRSLGALLEVLEEAGELERTLVVMVADHGESRMDHGEATHAFLAYGSTLHVPLIFHLPGRPVTAGRRIAERVGTVDLVPTVLDLLGFEIPVEVQGRSLAPLMLDAVDSDVARGDQNRTTYYSESLSPRLSHGVGELRALYRGPYKYIHGPRPELFDLGRDPGEVHDLASELPEERGRFEEALADFVERHARSDAAAAVHEVDEATRQKLEALGYLSSTGEKSTAVSEVLSMEGAVPQDRVGDINLMSRLRHELGTGQFHFAKLTALELLRVDPDNAYYQGRLAAAHLGLGQVAEAASVVEAAATVGAANQADFLAVAQALFTAGEKERGVTMAERLVEAAETVESRLLLADMHSELGTVEAFERQLQRALELEPEHPGARLRQARHLAESGDAAGAEALYRRLVIDFPVDVQAQVGYARVLRELDRQEEALARLERALRLAPGFCEAHLEHLQTLVDLERELDTEAALRQLREHCRDEETRTRAVEMVASVRKPHE